MPHFAAYQKFRDTFASDLPKYWTVISLLDDPKEITERIAGSDLVISNSLHGLIVTDAYDVPSIGLHPDVKIKCDGFKFGDNFNFRGAPIARPFDLKDILSRPSDFSGTPAETPSEKTIQQLVKAFPFR